MSKKNQQTTKRVKEMQAAAKKAEQRRRNLIVGAVAVAVIVVVVGIGILIQQNRDDTGAGSAAPAGVTDTYAIARGDDSASVTVTVYEDFQCPACKQMESLVGDTLTSNVDDGTIRIEYRPIAFLDKMSSTDYSSRALATAACTLDESGPEAFFALHDLLFENQPAEQTAGLDDGALADLAAQAGADKSAIESCQSAGTFDGWVKAATDAASKDNVTGTPTFLVNDELLEFSNDTDPNQTLQEAIDAAASN